MSNDGDEALEAEGFTGSRNVIENYGYSESSEAIPPEMWPDKWADARAHGRWIAHRLDNKTLYDFLYARTGAYEGQTMPLEEFGVPALKMASAIPGWKPTNDQVNRVTIFPSYLALASTWDPYMIQDVAKAVAEEFIGLGANTMLGPAVNVHRATQHNEVFDSLAGEDPTLGSVLTRFWCLTVHHAGIITVPKFLGRVEQVPVHFYNMTANQTAWEIFYPPFQSAVDSGAAGIMCDAHEVNGVWACRDFDVLTRDLKGLMGFQGMVVSNHGSAMNYFPDPQPTSFERGVDMTLNEPTVLPATPKGSAAMVQAAVRVLAAIWHMRLEEDSGCKLPCTKELKRNMRSAAHSAVAKRAAASAVVLLKNDGDVLPLTRDKVKTVGLVGPAAAELPQEETENEADYYTGVKEEHIQGVKFLSPAFGLWSRGKAKGIRVTQNLTDADVCIVIGGSKRHHDHWRVDIESVYAIEEAAQKCPKVVVLLEVMGAVLTPWRDQADAIMSIFHAGEETATAWAVTVFGDGSPSGKLPISFPMVTEEMVEYWKEPLPSYMSPSFKHAYPFGHGLSYASFLYQDIREKPRCHYPLCLMVTVLNSHPVNSGAEVVQVYFRFERAHYPLVLRGFYKTKVLKPGQTEKAIFTFNHRDISLFTALNGWAVKEDSWMPQDNITVLVGSSSQDIRGQLVVAPRHAQARDLTIP